MLLPPAYYPVYHQHVRLLPEPSLHANPLLQTPPMAHLEGLHTIQWIMSEPKQLSSTVRGDGLRFAFKGHDSGRLIPHLPLPPSAGPFLLDTLDGSRYQILFHQPHVLLDGAAAGVFQFVIAPPWRCIELALPMPKFLARAGRAAAARGSLKRLESAREKLKAGERAEQAWSRAESLRQGMEAVEELAAAEQGRKDAEQAVNAAEEAEQRRQELVARQEQQDSLREARERALEEKRELDRLSRRNRQRALHHDEAATAAYERAQRSTGEQRARELAWAREQRAQAARARQEARAGDEQARQRAASARDLQQQLGKSRAEQRSAEERRAELNGKKKENPLQQATGQGNAGLLAPSLLAHVPFPATVQIQVSWSQIGETWVAGLLGAAAEALKYYVGFVIDGVLAPGAGKAASFALDLVKSGLNETLIDGGLKYLLEGRWEMKVSKKLGPVKVSASCVTDPATGTTKWTSSLDHKGDSAAARLVGKAQVSLEGQGTSPEKVKLKGRGHSSEHVFAKPPADYAPGVPLVN